MLKIQIILTLYFLNKNLAQAIGDKNMRYYELHEQAYKKLKEEGHDSWDEFLGNTPEFELFGFKEFLEEALAQTNFEAGNLTALEIGCGTGPASCFLSQRGFVVDGVDVSETAVEVARVQAQKRGVHATFRKADICRDELDTSKYDLIVDGHCTHCIVTEEDRHQAFINIHQALKNCGFFFMSTMLGNDNCTFGKDSYWDDEGILWVRVEDASNYKMKTERNGNTYIPHRRIYRDHGKLEAELGKAGFTIMSYNIMKDEDEDAPSTYQAICRRS
jgi:2-polyprenyl-3-methyl-5-hydroxy-6-metoxy-1,4-benzoquinol methylase